MSDTISSQDAVTPTTGEAEAPSLSLSDIQNAVAVIDYAADQGAYKGWSTIEKVMLVRNRMTMFLTAAAPPAEASAESVGEGATVTEATPEHEPS